MMINLMNTYLHCLNSLTTIYSDNLMTALDYTHFFTRFWVACADWTLGVLYASTLLRGEQGLHLITRAIDELRSSINSSPKPTVLWSAQYQQQSTSGTDALPAGLDRHVLRFPPASMDAAFDDAVFDHVKDIWEKVMGQSAGDFLVFQDRELYDDDDE